MLNFRSDSVAASNAAAGPMAAPVGPARGGAHGFDRLLDMMSKQREDASDDASAGSVTHDAPRSGSAKTNRAGDGDEPSADDASKDSKDRDATAAAILPFLTGQDAVLRRLPIAAAAEQTATDAGSAQNAGDPNLARAMAIARLAAQRAADANANASATAAAAQTADNPGDAAANAGTDTTTLTAAANAAIAAEAARELAIEPDRHPAAKNGAPIDTPRDFHRIPFGTADHNGTQTRQTQTDTARTNNSRTTTEITPTVSRAASGPSPSVVPVHVAQPTVVGAAMAVIESAQHLASATLESDATSVVSQLVEAMRLQATRGGGEAQVTLEPKYLGAVTLSIRVDRDVVTASAVVESPMVREWMRSNEGLLRQGLAEHGLRLDRLHVAEPPVETPSREKETGSHTPARDQRQQKSRQRQQSEPAPAFELNV